MRFRLALTLVLGLVSAGTATAQIVPGGPLAELQDRIRCTNDANFMTASTPLEVEIRDAGDVLLVAAFQVGGPQTLPCANIRYQDELPALVLRFLIFDATLGRSLFWLINLDTAEVFPMEERAFSERYFGAACSERAELQLAPLRDPRSFREPTEGVDWAMDQLYSDLFQIPVTIYRKTDEGVCVPTQQNSNRFWTLVVLIRPLANGPLVIEEQ